MTLRPKNSHESSTHKNTTSLHTCTSWLSFHLHRLTQLWVKPQTSGRPCILLWRLSSMKLVSHSFLSSVFFLLKAWRKTTTTLQLSPHLILTYLLNKFLLSKEQRHHQLLAQLSTRLCLSFDWQHLTFENLVCQIIQVPVDMVRCYFYPIIFSHTHSIGVLLLCQYRVVFLNRHKP